MTSHLSQDCLNFDLIENGAISVNTLVILSLQIEDYHNCFILPFLTYCLNRVFLLNFLLYAVIHVSGLIKGLIFVGYVVSKNVHQNLTKGKNVVITVLFRKNKILVNKS